MWRWLLVMFAIGLFGCGTLTQPDDGDWSKMLQRVRDLPEELKVQARSWVANRRARKMFCEDTPKDTRVGTIECVDKQSGASQSYDVHSDEICECLGGWEVKSRLDYSACWATSVLDRFGQFWHTAGRPPLDPECQEFPFPIWAPQPDWDPDHVSDDEILRELLPLKAPPVWLPVGEIAEWLPLLCALSATWCDGVSSSGSSSSTGDAR